ncbi:MAG: 50S ribosomal protein L6 [Candidatus Gottesmanbacteria bacterium]
MSRIGKLPIIIPSNVTLKVDGSTVTAAGPKGELTISIPRQVMVNLDNGQAICQTEKQHANLWGLTRTLINNAVLGVSQGWNKSLELSGVGYRAAVEGSDLVLTVGFSHTVRIKAPLNITFTVNENKITINGNDKQLVGETAAQIRRIRPPEPYKGKGIKYPDEKIRRKLGKAAKTIGAAPGGKA